MEREALKPGEILGKIDESLLREMQAKSEEVRNIDSQMFNMIAKRFRALAELDGLMKRVREAMLIDKDQHFSVDRITGEVKYVR